MTPGPVRGGARMPCTISDVVELGPRAQGGIPGAEHRVG